VLASALASLDPEALKTRPRLLTALATSHVRQGNIEAACQLGADAFTLATRQAVAPNLQDVRLRHRRAVALAQPAGRPGTPGRAALSASDVIRLAVARLRDQLSEDDLRTELIAHVRAEAKQYPGRARRGLPKEQPQR
jgi:hypothetical protein